MTDKKRTEISRYGEFGLIDELTKDFVIKDKSTTYGVGDDAAVIDNGDNFTLVSTDILLEGINYDLSYFPMKHLGYKAVVVGCSDILAMNGTPRQITLALGISAKLSVESLREFYEGVRAACEDYEIDLVGGDTSSSLTGFTVAITAIGTVEKENIVYRSGASENDLICITGDLGSAYMGLHLLERERRALDGHPDPQPKFEGYEYLLERQLKPRARKDIIEALAEDGIIPTSMIDLSDGLSSDLLQICKKSECGARVYLDRLPIAKQTYDLAEELNIDPVVAALNGGDDHELLFTVPLDMQERVFKLGGINVIGYITTVESGVGLVTPDGDTIAMTAPGHVTVSDK